MPRESFMAAVGDSSPGFSFSEPAEVETLNDFFGADPNEVQKVVPDNKKKAKPVRSAEPSEEDDEDEVPKKKAKPTIEKPILEDLFGSEDESTESDDDEDEDLDEPEPVKKKEPTPEPPKDEPEESTYALLAKDLINLGIFTPDQDDDGIEVPLNIKTPEEFRNQFQLEVRKQTATYLENFLEQHGPEYQEMFQAVFVNGVPPADYLASQAKIDNYSTYSIESEENQEKIVRQLYRLEGKDPEKIDKRIEKLKSYGDLETEAEEAKQTLIQREQQNQQNLAAQKQRDTQEKIRQKTEHNNNVHKILNDKLKEQDFDGIPLDKATAVKALEYLTKDAYKLPNGQLITPFDNDILSLNRPENHYMKVKVGMLMQMLKTDPTLSKLGKKQVSKQSDSIFKELERKTAKKAQSQNSNKRIEDRFSSSDF